MPNPWARTRPSRPAHVELLKQGEHLPFPGKELGNPPILNHRQAPEPVEFDLVRPFLPFRQSRHRQQLHRLNPLRRFAGATAQYFGFGWRNGLSHTSGKSRTRWAAGQKWADGDVAFVQRRAEENPNDNQLVPGGIPHPTP
jgi:hypothetical protein